jgi:putative tricarboxylic transport membrane protein
MFASDRIFGALVVLGSLVYIAAAAQIPAPFFSDPMGTRAFPMIVGACAAICGAMMVWKPDAEPEWPGLASFGALIVATIALVGYAYAIKPLGFLLPTAVVSTILSYQIAPRVVPAILSGFGLSIGLFVLFRFVLDLGLIGIHRDLF